MQPESGIEKREMKELIVRAFRTSDASDVMPHDRVNKMRYGQGIGFKSKPFDLDYFVAIVHEKLTIYESGESQIPETPSQPEPPSS